MDREPKRDNCGSGVPFLKFEQCVEIRLHANRRERVLNIIRRLYNNGYNLIV